MSFVDNELFDDIIVGEYRDDDGKIIKNVYTTKDDAALVIGISTFENLLAKSKSGVGRSYAYMTFDEAEAMYGEEIRAKYREKLKAKREAKLKAQQETQKANPQPQTEQVEQKPVTPQITYEDANRLFGDKIRQEYQENLNKLGVVQQPSRKEIAKTNLSAAISAKKSQADKDKTIMIKLISYGKTKGEIIDAQGFSRTKVEKFIKDLKDKVNEEGLEKTKEYVLDLVKTYSEVNIVNYGEDMNKVTNFTDLYHCSYKEVQKAEDDKRLIEEARQRNIEEHNRKEAIKANEIAEEQMRHLDECLPKFGITRTELKPEPVAETDKDGDEIADIDLILSRFSGVDSTPTPAPVEAPDTSADVNSYIEKMKELQKKSDKREQILPTKQEVCVDNSEADEWGE